MKTVFVDVDTQLDFLYPAGALYVPGGERIVPAIIAAMPTSAHRPVFPGDTSAPNSSPTTPPIMSSGASTPPEVPEPKATDQMTALTTASRNAAAPVRVPTSRACLRLTICAAFSTP